MSFNSTAHKISNNEILNNGVVGDPDIPGRSTHDQQMKLDELATFIAKQKINPLLDDMAHPTIGVPTVSEMNVAIADAVFDTGAADMNKAVYDTGNRETDIYDYADTAAGNAFIELNEKFDTKAAATVTGNDFEIVSDTPKASTFYTVQFIAPEDFDGGRTYKIDGDTVSLKDMNGEALDDAWKEDAVITLNRNGADAFFKMGGSDSLNVIIADTADDLPAVGKPGQICVITLTPISDLCLTQSAPTERTDGSPLSGGELWINTTGGNIPKINLSKKQGIYIQPSKVFQYISGVWVPKTGFYWTTSWQSLATFLYDTGNEFSAITGGYDYLIRTSGTGSDLIAQNDGTDIELNVKTYSTVSAITKSSIDFSSFNSMNVKIKTVASATYLRFRILLTDAPQTPQQIQDALGGSSSTTLTGQIYIAPTTSIDTTLNLDISGISGNKYMILCVSARDSKSGDQLNAKIRSIELL